MLSPKLPIYFLTLPYFDPEMGIDTNDFNKSAFLCYENRSLFLRNNREISFHFSDFPFESFKANDNVPIFISEENLINLFIPKYADKSIIINHVRLVRPEDIDLIKEHFIKGYLSGYEKFEQEINASLAYADSQQKAEIVLDFINYCHHHLYFEGFAIPGCLFALGYIQANLVRACALYKNLTRLKPIAKSIEFSTQKNSELPGLKQPSEPKIVVPETITVVDDAAKTTGQQTGVYTRIPIKYGIEDIKGMWMILLDCNKIKTLKLPLVYTRQEQVLDLLAMMFEDVSETGNSWPNTKHTFQTGLSMGYINIFNLLMHATYKLNGSMYRINLSEFSLMLKKTFSCYHKATENSISTNIKKNADATIKLISNMQKSRYKNNALKAFRKVGAYNIPNQ
jgi:hypothetical protein